MPNPRPAVTVISQVQDRLTHLKTQLRTTHRVVECGPSNALTDHPSTPFILFHLEQFGAPDLQLIQQIKKQWPTSRLIVLADQPSPQEVIQTYEQGADDCLLFPVDGAELQQKLQPLSTSWWRRIEAWVHRRFRSQHSRIEPPLQLINIQKDPVLQADFFVQFFGSFSILNNQGEGIGLKGLRTQSLLACLLYHRKKGISRDRLISYFWPEVGHDSARNSLNVAISHIRQNLRPFLEEKEIIVLVDGYYYINETLTFLSDIDLFLGFWRQGQQHARLEKAHLEITDYRRALGYYQGDFLPQMAQQEWTCTLRDNFWETRLVMLERLMQYYLERENYAEAIQTGQSLLEQDGCFEKVHRQLMYCHYRMGNRTRALRQFQKCCSILEQELDTEPSIETRELYSIILEQADRVISFPLI